MSVDAELHGAVKCLKLIEDRTPRAIAAVMEDGRHFYFYEAPDAAVVHLPEMDSADYLVRVTMKEAATKPISYPMMVADLQRLYSALRTEGGKPWTILLAQSTGEIRILAVSAISSISADPLPHDGRNG
jgi:hypothetical protein